MLEMFITRKAYDPCFGWKVIPAGTKVRVVYPDCTNRYYRIYKIGTGELIGTCVSLDELR